MNSRTADGLGTQLRRLLEMMDGDVEAMYRDKDPVYSPRFTPVMKALSDSHPLSIKEIAGRSSISHSAASQTISIMAKKGLVTLAPDIDKRSRLVSLSVQGKKLLPWLNERWSTVNKAADALDQELDFPLSELLAQAIDALEKRSFAERIQEQDS